MTFFARVLRFLFWVAVTWWAVSLLRRLTSQTSNSQASPNRDIDLTNGSVSQKLVRDPVCGMHIAPTLVLSVTRAGDTVHFCSTECRDQYLNNMQKFVANA